MKRRFTDPTSKEQLKHYASAVCDWEKGDSVGMIAVRYGLNALLIDRWVSNFDRVCAGGEY